MPHGRLEVICGPMFAGKSTELLKRILWARNGERREVLVLKPAFDTRYGEDVIRSHNGLSSRAEPIAAWPAIPAAVGLVFVDEVQFLTEPYFEGDLAGEIRALLARGVDVVAGGLDMDWQGRPFPVTAALLAMADSVVKLRADCTVCGRPAARTFKRFPDGEQVALGALDAYESRCNEHWHTGGVQADARAA